MTHGDKKRRLWYWYFADFNLTEEEEESKEAEAIAAIVAALAIGASAQATATSLSPVIGVPVSVLFPLLTIAKSKPAAYGLAKKTSPGAATQSEALEITYRAQYVYAASRRVAAAVASGVSREQALAAEHRYFNQHIDAIVNRKESAIAVDEAAAKFGDELGWYAKMDARTTEECRQANGRNFNASRMPAIGYPGAVHPHCRCKAGRKHATSNTVYTIKVKEHAS